MSSRSWVGFGGLGCFLGSRVSVIIFSGLGRFWVLGLANLESILRFLRSTGTSSSSSGIESRIKA